MVDLLGPWYRFGKRFEHKVEDSFETLGRSVGRNPCSFIITVLVFTLLCAIGFLNYREETDGSKLWVPADTRAQKDDDYIERFYGEGYRGGSVLFKARQSIDKNIVDLDAFDHIWDVHEIIAEKVKADGGRTWDDICALKDGANLECFVNGVIGFFSGNRTYYDETVNSLADLRTAISAEEYPDGRDVSRDRIFGDYEVDSDTNEITSAVGTILYYSIDNKPLSKAEAWEADFIDRMDGQSNNDVNVFYIADRSLSDVFGAAIQGDVVLTSITYILMIIITCIVFAKRCSLVETRTALGLSGIITVVLAMLAGYGLCSGFGVPFVPLHQVLPFIVVGIGVDDMFIIVSTFDAHTLADPGAPVSERLARTFRRCGISIAYTTATDVVAFFLGATSVLPAIQAFCLYAAFSVLFNFFFQITLFSALLCEDAERIDRGHYDFLGCCYCSCICGTAAKKANSAVADEESSLDGAADKKSKHGGTEYAAISNGHSTGADANESKADPPTTAAATAAAAESNSAVVVTEPTAMATGHDTEGAVNAKADADTNDKKTAEAAAVAHAAGDEEKWGLLQKFFANYYFPLIIRAEVRVMVVLGFLTLLAMGIYGATLIELGFDQVDFAPDGSYVRQYFDKAEQLDLLASEQNLPVSIYYKAIDYYEEDTQKDMIKLQNNFLKERYNTGPFNSWIEDFIEWVPSSSSPYQYDVNADGYLTDPTLFYQAVEYFVGLDEYNRYEDDIIFENEDDDDEIFIKSSRTTAFHIDLTTAERQVDAMLDARSVVDDAPISPDPIVYAPGYISFETFIVIVKELTLNLSMALVGVVLVSLFVLQRPTAVLLVALMVLMIDVELIGMMHFWDLQINSISVVQLVMAVGLVVDYVSHVMHYYLQQSPDRSAEERLKDALVEIGPSVLLGCFTTFMGVVPLAFSTTVVFRTFFKMFLLIITLGGAHGLILLPVLLPLVPFSDIRPLLAVDAPVAVSTAEDDEDDKITNKKLATAVAAAAASDNANANASANTNGPENAVVKKSSVVSASQVEMAPLPPQQEPAAADNGSNQVVAADDEGGNMQV